jgi:beta-lactamase class A
MFTSPKVFFGVFLIFAIGVISGYGLFTFLDRDAHSNVSSNSKQVRQVGEYRYINPLLECEVAEGTIDARKQNFRKELVKEIEAIKKKSQLTEAAVYFRDLNNGPAFGVDEAGEFFPASLLKVPVMMAYYRWSEQEPDLLSAEILYSEPRDFGVSVAIKPREELVPGTKYTVEELIKRMVIFSDNQALALLTPRLPQERIHELFGLLGVGEDVIVDPQGRLTVKEYAGFFRILFNSSYLSRENSEKALLLLASTDYNDALPAGVPKDISVSHKFGEAGTGMTERQLHDCGIVYFPDHPYLACIMTRGKELDNLKQSIVDISKFIYGKIDEQY